MTICSLVGTATPFNYVSYLSAGGVNQSYQYVPPAYP
jgi:hypothetical protein